DDCAFINDESILVQNIVAHIQYPYPRIQIAATTIEKEKQQTAVILDTVNQLNNTSLLSTHYILGVLNSKIISWYTYKFIYANAIRTMHFDSSTTDRIPFPDMDWNNPEHMSKHDLISDSVKQIQELRSELQKPGEAAAIDLMHSKIDDLQEIINNTVCELFGLTQEEYQSVG
ncbi:MAG TPA: hypothetical protein VNS32_26830, partial [Flavisolibacter sp.]|nr:hypothetical protein [Flavisolibacter sp.]